jgi:uncharacterized protein (TIGR02266 family)
MATRQDRTEHRQRVHLQVRYATAEEFVVEYAENLCQGGLFIAGAHNLAPLSEVTVEISLPGAGSFQVRGEVAHVLVPAVAERHGRRPGAGIAIRHAPKGFREALASYLLRLGRRADVLVWCYERGSALDLERAGYRVDGVPAPENVATTFVRSEAPVMAIVVPRARELVYRQALVAAGGSEDMVVAMDDPAELDAVLAALDQLL